MGLAVLSKGLIGIVLPSAVIMLYSLLTRDWKIWKKLHLVAGLLVFAAITLPWFIAVSIQNPEFAHFFFIHEHLQRFTSKIHHREGPWYYFAPLLLLGCIPWWGVFFQSMVAAWKKPANMISTPVSMPASSFQPKKLLLIWAAFIFVFFSVSSSKLPSYILPIFPALALLIACYLDTASRKTLAVSTSLFAIIAVAGFFALPFLPGFSKTAYEIPLYEAAIPYVGLGLACLLIASVLTLWFIFRKQQPLAVLLLATGGFLFGQNAMLGHEQWGRYAAGTIHVAAIQKEMTADTSIYAVKKYEAGVAVLFAPPADSGRTR